MGLITVLWGQLNLQSWLIFELSKSLRSLKWMIDAFLYYCDFCCFQAWLSDRAFGYKSVTALLPCTFIMLSLAQKLESFAQLF